MRASLLLVTLALAGCTDNVPPDPPVVIGPNEPPDPGPNPPVTLGCQHDSDCNDPGEVCARDGDCVPADDVHAVKVIWTVSGNPANATSCANVPPLEVGFAVDDSGITFGFAPVPCDAGEFPIDKLELEYTSAAVGYANGGDDEWAAPIDPMTGLATIDLPL